jgi:hypothetical protein
VQVAAVKRLLALFALVLVGLLLASCLPVPFDVGVSQAVAAAGKMTRDNPSLITQGYNRGPSAQGFAFYPQVLASGGFDYSAGFITFQDNTSVNIQAFANGSTYGGTNQFIANPDPHAPASLGWPVKSGTSFLFGIVFDAVNPASGSGYSIFQATPPSTFTSTGTSLYNLVLALTGNTTVIGASVESSASSTFDVLHVLGAGPTSYSELAFSVQSSGVVNAPAPRSTVALPFIPAGTTRVMYFYDDYAAANNRSFGSWFDQAAGSWVSYAWWEQPAGTLNSLKLPTAHRLDALLSTGRLLSTEGGTGRLYDQDGNLQATFPLGNLVYIAEEYVGGVARCYFSQCMVYDRQLHFNVYWIPTDQLATLAN